MQPIPHEFPNNKGLPMKLLRPSLKHTLLNLRRCSLKAEALA